jgi:sensor histidine kinase regulating citrate/malate metabolism
MNSRGWSLARQLVVLQICVVMLTVGIEAMVGVYRGANGTTTWEQQQLLGLVALTEVVLTVGIAGSLLVADRVHRQTFGLEPAVIARQHQHHQAILRAVREGSHGASGGDARAGHCSRAQRQPRAVHDRPRQRPWPADRSPRGDGHPGWTTKTTETPGGRGLGLALVRPCRDPHGRGTISAANDGGTVFHIYLPS